MTQKTKGLFLILAAFMLSGCATIVSGTTQKISVASQPSGADAKADNSMTAKTPTTFTLDRKNDHTIEISKDGYKTATIMIKKTFNGMVTGNILIGGLIGTGIDAATGSMNKLIPERVDVILETGSGYSDIPKFASQKDADYYEKSILNVKKMEDQKKSSQAERPREAAKTNFSPKTATPPLTTA